MPASTRNPIRPTPSAEIRPDWTAVETALDSYHQALKQYDHAQEAFKQFNAVINQRMLDDHAMHMRRENGLIPPTRPGAPLVVHGLAQKDPYEALRLQLHQATSTLERCEEAITRYRTQALEARKQAVINAQRAWLLVHHSELADTIHTLEEKIVEVPDSAQLRQKLRDAWRELWQYGSDTPDWSHEGPTIPT